MRPWFATQPFLNLMDWTTKPGYHEARFERDSRYYVIRLSCDLLEDWIITLVNGRIKSRLGQSRTIAFASFDEGMYHFCTQAGLRHQRRYRLVNLILENPLMWHLLPFMVYITPPKAVPAIRLSRNRSAAPVLNKLVLDTTGEQLGFAF